MKIKTARISEKGDGLFGCSMGCVAHHYPQLPSWTEWGFCTTRLPAIENYMSTEDLLKLSRAGLVDLEYEQEFKVGDWVMRKDGGDFYHHGFSVFKSRIICDEDVRWFSEGDHFQLAPPEPPADVLAKEGLEVADFRPWREGDIWWNDSVIISGEGPIACGNSPKEVLHKNGPHYILKKVEESMKPTEEDKRDGLKPKYAITHADGSPCDPDARYFVLRYDFHNGCDGKHVEACQRALREYAYQIADHLPALSRELRDCLDKLERPNDKKVEKKKVPHICKTCSGKGQCPVTETLEECVSWAPKQDDEPFKSEMQAEPYNEVPRIFTRCPACGHDSLTINKGHLLCTWHKCSDPTLIDRTKSRETSVIVGGGKVDETWRKQIVDKNSVPCHSCGTEPCRKADNHTADFGIPCTGWTPKPAAEKPSVDVQMSGRACFALLHPEIKALEQRVKELSRRLDDHITRDDPGCE